MAVVYHPPTQLNEPGDRSVKKNRKTKEYKAAWLPLPMDGYLNEKNLTRLMERAQRGQLLCEFGSPKIPPDATHRERVERWTTVPLGNVCAAIVELDVVDGKVLGKVKPAGPKADLVAQAIELRGADALRFGIRASEDKQRLEVFTWDLINIV